MIAFFPDPVPEQMLADVFGRYQILARYKATQFVNHDLFGEAKLPVNLDFPTNLAKLISNLPPNHQYTVDGLIDAHTILPYYAPFLPLSRLAEIREMMKTFNGKQIAAKIGIEVSSLRRPNFLRYCPVCIQKDRDKKFLFFRRVHQLGGVEVCPDHAVFLVSTTAPTNSRTWVCAEVVITSVSDPEYVDLNTEYGALLLAIAGDSQWLLNHPNITMGPDEIIQRYRIILANRGMASATGVPHVKKIRELIRDFFPAELLERLQCPVKEDHDWVDKVLTQTSALPPIYHILLLRFLGISLEQFLSQDWKLKSFGHGPWPCFNPVAYSHKYREPTIKEVKIDFIHDPKKKIKKLIGIFSCPCGFSYWLFQTITTDQRAPRSKYVLSRGQDWDQELRTAWNNPNVGNYDLRLRFRLRWKDLLDEATRLNLAVPRKGKKSTYIRSKKQKPVLASPINSEAEFATKREKMREEWLELRKEYPDHNTMKLAKLKPTLYDWLYKHDKDWLAQNTPPRISITLNWTKEELQQADIEIAAMIPEMAIRLKTANGKPKKVTAPVILKALGKYWFAHRHKVDLTVTWNTAQQFAENDEEWNERKRSYHSR